METCLFIPVDTSVDLLEFQQVSTGIFSWDITGDTGLLVHELCNKRHMRQESGGSNVDLRTKKC